MFRTTIRVLLHPSPATPMKTFVLPLIAFAALLAAPVLAQDATAASTNSIVDLSDFEAAPDGVSILALDSDEFKMLSIATAPYKSKEPAALSAARTVAITKAKAGLSRFLNENVSAEDYMEKETTRVKVSSPDGSETVARAQTVRILSRIRTESKSLLRGVVVLQTERIPDEEGPGGSFRVLVGVSSATLEGAEALQGGIGTAAP